MLKSKIKQIVRDNADKNYPKKIVISCASNQAMLNNSCMYNAVNKCMLGESSAVVECVVITNSQATAHYINLQPDGSFVDFTLGWHWSSCDYRFIRYVPYTEWGSIGESLDRLKCKLSEPVKLWKRILMLNDNDIC